MVRQRIQAMFLPAIRQVRTSLLVAALAAGAGTAAAPASDSVRQARLSSALDSLSLLCEARLSPSERETAARLIEEVRRSARADSGRALEGAAAADAPMAPERFAALVARLAPPQPESSRTAAILSATRDARITCAQLATLLDLYAFDTERLELVHGVAGRVADPENAATILARVRNSILRDDLADFLAKTRARVPVASAAQR